MENYDTEFIAVCDIDDKALDAAYITTSVNLHRIPLIIAAERGLHIFFEKPIATTIEDCFETKIAIKQASVKSLVAYNNRWNPFLYG